MKKFISLIISIGMIISSSCLPVKAEVLDPISFSVDNYNYEYLQENNEILMSKNKIMS